MFTRFLTLDSNVSELFEVCFRSLRLRRFLAINIFVWIRPNGKEHKERTRTDSVVYGADMIAAQATFSAEPAGVCVAALDGSFSVQTRKGRFPNQPFRPLHTVRS